MDTTKICTKCKIEKDFSCFYPCKQGKFSLGSWCKQCVGDYQKIKRATNPEFREARHTYNAEAWASMTPEERDTYNVRRRAYSASRREETNAKSREQWASSPEFRKIQNEKKMNRYRTDPDFRLKESLRTRIRQALVGDSKGGSAVGDLGCSIPEFRTHLESKFQPGMTWENWGRGNDKWNIDHIIPLSYYTLSDRQHFVLASHYLNMQPLWQKDNFTKHDTYPEAYLASLAAQG